MRSGPMVNAAKKMKWLDEILSVLDFNGAIENNKKVYALKNRNEKFDYLGYYVECSKWIVLETIPKDGSKRISYRFFEKSEHLPNFMNYFNTGKSDLTYEQMCLALSSVRVKKPPVGLIEIRSSPEGIQYLDSKQPLTIVK